MLGLRPEKHCGKRQKNESGLTGHIEKMYVVNLELTKNIQYLPQELLFLNSEDWNKRINHEARLLAKKIYKWKCHLRDHVIAFIIRPCSMYGTEREAKNEAWLMKQAKLVGLKKEVCKSLKEKMIKGLRQGTKKRSRENELNLITKEFKLTKKTCLTTGEDYRFSGQLLCENGLNSCLMLNWFYVKEQTKVAKESKNQTGSFLPTPERQHERILHIVKYA